MIFYTLSCEKGHRFEGWFRGSQDFEGQADRGLLTCPVCSSAEVSKALMAPNVSTARGKEKAAQEVRHAMAQAQAAIAAEDSSSGSQAKPVEGKETGGSAEPSAPMVSMKDMPEPVKAFREAARKLRDEVEASSEDVGKRFADEARKMHYGEAEERAIRGEASLEEAAALDEEGIDVFVLPTLPEDGH